MRILLTILATGVLNVGCASVLQPPSTLRPPSHPLLTTATWLSESTEYGPSVSDAPKTAQPNHMLRVQLNLKGLKKARYRTQEHVMNLVRAAYHGTPFRQALGHAHTTLDLKSMTYSVSGRIQSGDLVFFSGAHDSPRLAIVLKRRGQHKLTAVTIIRGAARPIFIDLKRGHVRRVKGKELMLLK